MKFKHNKERWKKCMTVNKDIIFMDSSHDP